MRTAQIMAATTIVAVAALPVPAPGADRITPGPGTAGPAPPAPSPYNAARANAPGSTSEADARARCPMGTIVWINPRSKVYHYAGTRAYGHAEGGIYMCEKDAQAAGGRPAQEDERP